MTNATVRGPKKRRGLRRKKSVLGTVEREFVELDLEAGGFARTCPQLLADIQPTSQNSSVFIDPALSRGGARQRG